MSPRHPRDLSIQKVKDLASQLNEAVVSLATSDSAIKIEYEVMLPHYLGIPFAVPLLQVKLSEVKNL